MLVYKFSAKFSKARSSIFSLRFGINDESRGQTEFVEKELGREQLTDAQTLSHGY